MKAILDTNILVYNFIEDSEFHKDENLKKKLLEIFDACIIEPIFEEDIKHAVHISKNLKKINDDIIISVCKRLNAPLFTYDKELKKRAKEFDIKLVQ